jgi:ubiquinol-cytochrome c reductase cytochrome c subunit
MRINQNWAGMRIASVVAAVIVLMGAYSAGAQTAATSPPAPPGNVDKGKTLFVERGCWQCHGTAAQGGGIAGPRLTGRLLPWPAFSKYVRRPTEEMIPYTDKVLTDAQLADIYAWLRAIPPPPPVGSLPQLGRK